MPGNAPFPIQPELTAIAIAYRNDGLIADAVLPRIPVGTQEFKYLKYRLDESFTVQDTRVGRKSAPNKVEFHADELTSQTFDYGLDDDIPQADIDNAPPNFRPVGVAVESLTDLVLLDREQRAASLVFGSANYPAGQINTLAGAAQWSDPSSDPIAAIMTGLDTPVMRPNLLVFGRPCWSTLARHPKMCAAVFKNGTNAGIVTRQQVADLFEVEEVLVGEAFVNTAKKGQATALARCWGKHAAALFRDKMVSTRGRVSWGYTAQWGSRVAGQQPNPNIGLRGGQTVRAGESVRELVTAPELGYFFQNAVA